MARWIFLLLSVVATPALAQLVKVTDAWARATVAGQHGTGAFMTLTATDGARLLGAASLVAGVVEIHQMAMQDKVMTMRAVDAIELPAGRSVTLAPGGYHLMLMDLERPLKPGESIRVELRLQTRDQRLVTQPVEVEVRSAAPSTGARKR